MLSVHGSMLENPLDQHAQWMGNPVLLLMIMTTNIAPFAAEGTTWPRDAQRAEGRRAGDSTQIENLQVVEFFSNRIKVSRTVIGLTRL